MAEEFEGEGGGFRGGRGRRGGGDFGGGGFGGGFGGLAPARGRKKKGILSRMFGDTLEYLDYKDVQLLSKHCSAQGKLFSRKRTANSAKYQRMVQAAVKRARFMALMPYVG